MQYMSSTNNNDLTSGYSTYLMNCSSKEVIFSVYTGDTAVGANEQGIKLNTYLRGYFLRKGFSDAIRNANPNVIVPVYKDNEDKEVFPESLDEAIKQIYDSKLNISGFRFNENATDAQKEEAIGELVNSFVSTSKNLDFSSDKNLFIVMAKASRVIYNNGGNENMKITGVDVQERLGLNTEEVAVQKKYREICLRQRV